MLELATSAIFEKLAESEEYKKISSKVLGNEDQITDEEYEVACMVFNQASEECFRLGFEACASLIFDMVMNSKFQNQ
jgi:hypothetical protein